MERNYEPYISGLMERSRKAQAVLNEYSQEQVDELVKAIAFYGTRPDFMRAVAEKTVEESGMGDVEDKIAKIWNKTIGHYREMKDEKSVGLIEFDKEKNVSKYAKPMGVIGALAPVTNAENTAVVKPMNAIKGRNSIILAPHPKAAHVNEFVIDYLRKVLKKFGAPEDLIIGIEPEYVSIDCSGELMKQCDFILATGGAGLVKAAYSSGTPAIGVGTGNDAIYVDGTTDLEEVAAMVKSSKCFDNATSCSTENVMLIQKECYDDFVKALQNHNGFLIKEGSEEKEQLRKTMWPDWPATHNLNRHIVAQPLKKITELAGLTVEDDTEFLFVEENDGIGHDHPFTGEKLSRVTTLIKTDSFEDAMEKMEAVMDYMGKGHGCGIHTSDDSKVENMALRMPVARMMVNQPQGAGNSGSWENGMPMTMTLGCGTWGNNSVSHNVNWKDLINITHVSRKLPLNIPKEEDMFGADYIKEHSEAL